MKQCRRPAPAGGEDIVAAIEMARRLGPNSRVLTLMVDSGLKYVSTDVYRMSEQSGIRGGTH